MKQKNTHKNLRGIFPLAALCIAIGSNLNIKSENNLLTENSQKLNFKNLTKRLKHKTGNWLSNLSKKFLLAIGQSPKKRFFKLLGSKHFSRNELISFLNKNTEVHINTINDLGETPIVKVTKDRNHNAMRVLLTRKANILIEDKSNKDALEHAIINGDNEGVKIILKFVPRDLLKKKDYLKLAMTTNIYDERIKDQLIQKGLDQKSSIELEKYWKNIAKDYYNDETWGTSKDGRSAMHNFASQHYMIEAIKILLRGGEPTYISDYAGLTPLNYALQSNNLEIMETLLRNTPIQYINKNILLHEAIDKGAKPEMIKLLMKYGYKTNCRQGEYNITAQELARKKFKKPTNCFQKFLNKFR